MTVELALIAALDENHAIGRDNALPWHLPDDLKRFKALTLGQPVLMGRKTAQSLGRALPGRHNLVLTRQNEALYPSMQAVASLDDALMAVRQTGAGTLWVIGGGEVYQQTLPHACRLHLTWVHTRIADADAFFPVFDAQQWRETARQMHEADERHAHAFSFVDYRRAPA